MPRKPNPTPATEALAVSLGIPPRPARTGLFACPAMTPGERLDLVCFVDPTCGKAPGFNHVHAPLEKWASPSGLKLDAEQHAAWQQFNCCHNRVCPAHHFAYAYDANGLANVHFFWDRASKWRPAHLADGHHRCMGCHRYWVDKGVEKPEDEFRRSPCTQLQLQARQRTEQAKSGAAAAAAPAGPSPKPARAWPKVTAALCAELYPSSDDDAASDSSSE
ncbi:unnamed protein product [Pedinophyceae sp. YPF-701]|nr:unnamed protein product [Pedinophyceae sp. YPF-701]